VKWGVRPLNRFRQLCRREARPSLVGSASVRRVALACFVGALLLGGIVSGAVVERAYQQTHSTLERETATQAAAIAATLANEPAFPPAGSTLLTASAGSGDSRFELLGSDGGVLVDSKPQTGGPLNQLESPEIRQAATTGSGAANRAVGDDEALVSAARVGSGVAPRGYVRISRPLAAERQLVSEVARTAALATLATALGALVIGWRLSRTATDRLDRLAQAAEALARGDRLPPASGDREGPAEMVRLARSLVDIGERLQTTTRDVTTERGTLAAVLAEMADGVLVMNAAGQIVLANPAADRILGLSETGHPARGRSYIEALRDHDLIQLVRGRLLSPNPTSAAPVLDVGPNARREESDGPAYFEIGLPRRFLRVQVGRLGDGRGLIVLQDLTEIRRAETVRRDFVANVSHELRTPLASLKALVETLQDGALEDASVAHDFLGRMDVEIDGLTQLVRELLDLSRIEAGRLTMQRESVDVATLLERAAGRLRAQADRAGLTLAVSAPPGLPAVRADAERLIQALINLIHNAVKFTPPGGRIELRGQGGRQRSDGSHELLPLGEPGPAPTHVIISVVDTGVGIAPEDLPRIFERFYKADKARSGGGTGLGLAIVKHIVEAHGGKVWAEAASGAGTAFRIAIPAEGRW
jgi:two-component system, OmpR family, phosphate regulon sensor histidine kinase PhoR